MKKIYFAILNNLNTEWLMFVIGLGSSVIFDFLGSADNADRFTRILILSVVTIVAGGILVHIRHKRDEEVDVLKNTPTPDGERPPTDEEINIAAGNWSNLKRRAVFFSSVLLLTLSFSLLIAFLIKGRSSEQSCMKELSECKNSVQLAGDKEDSVEKKISELRYENLQLFNECRLKDDSLANNIKRKIQSPVLVKGQKKVP